MKNRKSWKFWFRVKKNLKSQYHSQRENHQWQQQCKLWWHKQWLFPYIALPSPWQQHLFWKTLLPFPEFSLFSKFSSTLSQARMLFHLQGWILFSCCSTNIENDFVVTSMFGCICKGDNDILSKKKKVTMTYLDIICIFGTIFYLFITQKSWLGTWMKQ